MSISAPSKDDFILEGECLSEASTPKPEDSIPDFPENFEAREFLRTAPQHGLFMPLGKEVKVMQCWRCKAYGHRLEIRSSEVLCGVMLMTLQIW
jgi:hypothetical protein